LLPLNTGKKINDNSMDFYCGALLAVRNLGKEGIGTDLTVYDVGGETFNLPQDKIRESDIVIGPFSSSEIVKTLDLCPPSTFIISPLDPKAGYLAYSHDNVIQAPTPYEDQYKDIAEWIKEDMKNGDRIILLSEKGAKSPASSNTIKEDLVKSGISVKTVSYTIFESRNVYDMLRAVMDKGSANRVIIASESEAFANDAVRNLSLMEHDGFNVILYSPSKILTFDTIEVENYHNVNMHVSASYFIDYNNPEVERFVLDYRSLFNTEPSQFAFQGYDIAHYFIKMYSDYGKHFTTKLDIENPALQSDFKMKKAGNGGYINSAVRRFVYNPDYTVTEVMRKEEESWHWQ
jgi:ABC-type branched-subunit amino acid transport system substrate-binding protein